MQTIATRLSQVRATKGWSLSELGRRANMPASTVQRIELERNDPSIKIVRRLAVALEIDAVWLAFGGLDRFDGVDATVAARLLQARQAKGLSLRKLATLAAVEASTLSHIERGHGEPSLRVLRRLSQALDVSASWLGCLET